MTVGQLKMDFNKSVIESTQVEHKIVVCKI